MKLGSRFQRTSEALARANPASASSTMSRGSLTKWRLALMLSGLSDTALLLLGRTAHARTAAGDGLSCMKRYMIGGP